jgi:hypothetical protein
MKAHSNTWVHQTLSVSDVFHPYQLSADGALSLDRQLELLGQRFKDNQGLPLIRNADILWHPLRHEVEQLDKMEILNTRHALRKTNTPYF